MTCGYCKYSIANARERYYKKEYSKKYQKDIYAFDSINNNILI